MANKHMSLESVLDEERKDVLALLEGPPGGRTRGSGSSIGGSGRTSSPLAPVRSMLDVGDDMSPAKTRNASIAGTNGGVTPASKPAPIRSMLDPYAPPPPQVVRSMLDINGTTPTNGATPKRNASVSSVTRSAHVSPSKATHRAHRAAPAHPRSLSDAAARPASFGPRADGSAPGSVESSYQFSGYLPSNPGGPVVPKRNTQAGKARISLPSAMAEVVRNGGELTGLGSLLGSSRDRGRNNSITGVITHGTKSKSPANRFSLRSPSPATLSPDANSNKFVLNDGRVIDMDSAYRRLSDANLALSQGGLAQLSAKSRRRTNSGDAMGPNGSRLQKDYTPIDGEEALESSDEYDSDTEDPRGRKKGRAGSKDQETTLGMGRAKGPRTAQSLLAAVEDERQEVVSLNEKYKVHSLLDPPALTVSGPPGDRIRVSNPGVHPITSFDDESGFNTPVDSDTEADLTDIKRAQRLSITQTSIISTPSTSRCVRTLFRGDFGKMTKEAAENHRRVRKYLVATDLSDEAAHALEWTIGTVLRDGDTLLAIYCVDEELGIAATNDGSADDQMKEQAAAIAASTSRPGSISTPILGPTYVSHVPSPLVHAVNPESMNGGSGTPSPSGSRNKAEQERYRAVQDITDRVSKLLRKTKLQVKVVIEVIHCKSPKHLITEVIDYINPTLVILGSRGRSALKGVILGSFSNYLVTKSSVPVMVARKRLKKHTKYRRPAIKLTNNLTNPTIKSLASAKID